MAVHVVTDSTCDIPQDLIDSLHITVVPLTIQFGEQSYRDGVDLSADEFYERLRESCGRSSPSRRARSSR